MAVLLFVILIAPLPLMLAMAARGLLTQNDARTEQQPAV
jgi:hypothetical protein